MFAARLLPRVLVAAAVYAAAVSSCFATTLYISEHTIGTTANTQVAKQPPVAEQTVAISGVSAQSAAFNARTHLIRVHTDSICSIEIGSNPTAATTTARMAADQTEYFEVNAGDKIAVISNN